MYKLAICGKAMSGKNTFAAMIDHNFSSKNSSICHYLAFADPVKTIAKTMFPDLSEQHLNGESKYRESIIPNAVKNNNPLTVRQLLIDIGTGLGRGYNPDIWIQNLDYRLKSIPNQDLVIVTDCRFINEFKFLKNNGFTTIKIMRKDVQEINHVSEQEQDGIPTSKFDYVVHNNGTLKDLKKKAIIIVNKMLEIE